MPKIRVFRWDTGLGHKGGTQRYQNSPMGRFSPEATVSVLEVSESLVIGRSFQWGDIPMLDVKELPGYFLNLLLKFNLSL